MGLVLGYLFCHLEMVTLLRTTPNAKNRKTKVKRLCSLSPAYPLEKDLSPFRVVRFRIKIRIKVSINPNPNPYASLTLMLNLTLTL